MTTAIRNPVAKHTGALSIAPVYADHFRGLGLAIDVLAVRLDVDAHARSVAEALLSDDERQRASRFAQDRDRRRYTVARAYLRHSLAERLDVDPGSVAFRYGASGKPELASGHGEPNFRFNLSHSDEIAAFAFSVGRAVGIDIERIRPMQDLERTAKGSFSEHENEALRAIPPEQRLLSFFNCWTRKEAFVKALGSGLGTPLDSFDVSLAPDDAARMLRVSKEHGVVSDWHVKSFAPAPDFVGAVVVDGRSD